MHNSNIIIWTNFKFTYSWANFDKCVYPYNHHHNQDLEHFRYLEASFPAPSNHLSPPSPKSFTATRHFLSVQLM